VAAAFSPNDLRALALGNILAVAMSRTQPHQHLYGGRRWRRMAQAQLRVEPMCALCAARGQAVPAEVADHVVPHHGDQFLFWGGKLQSLCKRCHDSRKRMRERRGYDIAVGTDGWPLDPQHPVYAKRRWSRD
jgi:5-methylcytosine-specific restriction enzyme A